MKRQDSHEVQIIVLGQSDLSTLGVLRNLSQRDLKAYYICGIKGFVKYFPSNTSSSHLKDILEQILEEGTQKG